MTEPLSMKETAAMVGLSYCRFARSWAQLPGFPRPFRARKWSAEAVRAWIAERSRAPDGPPAPRKGAPDIRRIAAQRAELEALRGA